jgi:hypothetical protein
MGWLLVCTSFDAQIQCRESELAIFESSAGSTCAAYLFEYSSDIGPQENLTNLGYFQYHGGSDYLSGFNLLDYYYGRRDATIRVTLTLSPYILVFLLMILSTKASKEAK